MSDLVAVTLLLQRENTFVLLQDGQKVRAGEHNGHNLRQVLTVRKGKYSALSIIHGRIVRFGDYSLTILGCK